MTARAAGGIDVVIPTIGRPSLNGLLASLAAESFPGRVIVADDRRERSGPLLQSPRPTQLDLLLVSSGGRGPAAARNAGWRASTADWIAFLDDDVIVEPGWYERLIDDLDRPADVGAVQGRINVPLAAEQRPTDWARNIAALGEARWATADMAYRRCVLRAVNGFDERFPRAYREDADIALRTMAAGWKLVVGSRWVTHPVRPAPWHVSIGKQAGNSDDVLMSALHGPDWRARAGSPAGMFRRHVATTLAAAAAIVAVIARRRRLAIAAALGWLVSTVAFAWRRIAPGPRDRREVAAMLVTSAAIPPVAVWHRTAGTVRAWRMQPLAPRTVAAVLFDRDGTLVHDIPYNRDPSLVEPVDGAFEALRRLRDADVRIGIVTNQSGIARGTLTRRDVDAVNARVQELLGAMDVVLLCEHGPEDRCTCRKPSPGLILQAAARLGVAPRDCAVIGDIGSDVQAAIAAGALPVLVPNGVTSAEEIAAAPLVAADLATAVDLVLGVA